jgi:endonuclease/exonuclease/phosphatase (EEP) superfamily protein YafD
LRVAQCHLAGAALTPAQLASWLGQSRSDVLSTTGLASGAHEQLGQGAVGYTMRPGPQPDARLFVRTALLASLAQPRPRIDPRARPDTHVSLRIGSCDLDIAQLALPSLIAPGAASTRRRQLAPLASAEGHKRSLYVGSLGSRSAAHDLQPFLSQQGLRDVRLGHGRLATAPAALGPLGLPVDHILVRGWIAVSAADVAEPIVPGAHRTLHATLQLTEPRCR